MIFQHCIQGTKMQNQAKDNFQWIQPNVIFRLRFRNLEPGWRDRKLPNRAPLKSSLWWGVSSPMGGWGWAWHIEPKTENHKKRFVERFSRRNIQSTFCVLKILSDIGKKMKIQQIDLSSKPKSKDWSYNKSKKGLPLGEVGVVSEELVGRTGSRVVG